MSDPLNLTLLLDAGSQAWQEALRRKHFPPERNLIPAHVTLFHALPGAEIDAIRATLAEACTTLPEAVPVRIGPPRFLGRGVALEVASPPIAALHRDLALRWRGYLTRQDAQAWRPHATVQNKVAPDQARAVQNKVAPDQAGAVQNKVAPDQARALHAALSATLPVREARGAALLLWLYRGGPWEAAGRFALPAAGA